MPNHTTTKAKNTTGITKITQGPPARIAPPDGDNFRYGLGFPLQVGPRQAALLCNLRTEEVPTGDFENGVDVVLFDRTDAISVAVATPITRNETYVDPQTSASRIAIKYPIVGGFVPWGAQRDGYAHPGAGTGFGVSEALDFPLLDDGSYNKADKTTTMIRRTIVHQFAYEGDAFRITGSEVHSANNPLRVAGSDWTVYANGLHTAIPDGDDLLYPACATTSDASTCYPTPAATGVSRWRLTDGRWQLVGFSPVCTSRRAAHPRILYGKEVELVAAEPSLVRDADGSLLFSARLCGDDNEDHAVRVWRSHDKGTTWSLLIDLAQARGQAPVTINRAGDGTPYIAANALGHERDRLCLWPLNPQRTGLAEPLTIRDASEEFGPPPTGPVWFMDHPTGQTLRLADGQWHHVLVYRLMDRGEHSGAAPAPQTGLYVEEIHSAGQAIPVWNFAD
jgi:hypothetical protein